MDNLYTNCQHHLRFCKTIFQIVSSAKIVRLKNPAAFPASKFPGLTGFFAALRMTLRGLRRIFRSKENFFRTENGFFRIMLIHPFVKPFQTLLIFPGMKYLFRIRYERLCFNLKNTFGDLFQRIRICLQTQGAEPPGSQETPFLFPSEFSLTLFCIFYHLRDCNASVSPVRERT
jgi:hypothetical protein